VTEAFEMRPAPVRRRACFGLALASLLLTPVLAHSAEATDAGFEIVQGAAPLARPGVRATVSLSLLPRTGHRLLADGPLLVRLVGDGVTPERPLYRRDDAVDPRAEAPRFELAFVRGRGATAELRAQLTFYLCRRGRCRPVETEVRWNLPRE
jgi:hypothetical protein